VRLSLVADRELPEHLIADTERALEHLGWLGVRRRVSSGRGIHVLHLEGHVPPVTLSHDGHDHAGMLADLRGSWVALDVVFALVNADPAPIDGDPALAAVDLIHAFSPEPLSPGFRDDLVARLERLEALPDDALSRSVPTLPPPAQAFVSALGGPRDAVHVAGVLLGLRAV
jgi:hypothetical protein